jgi:uncharacterized protein YbcI
LFIPPDTQKALGASAARLVKRWTGRGPKHVHVDVLREEVAFFFRGVLSPLEKALLKRGGRPEMVEQIRCRLVEGWEDG